MPKHDLTINPALMNAAGSLGFSPDLHSPVDWSRLGAFVTNPVSLTARTPARGRRFIEFPGGFLLHTGYPNPGITRVVRQYAKHWHNSPVPVIVHLLAGSAEEVRMMTRRLEMVEGVSGLEVGMDSDASIELMKALTQAACGEYPVIVRLPIERSVELATEAMSSGATAISLTPPRGLYPTGNGELVKGRMYGPAILPVALRAVHELYQMSIPVIGAGGVYTQEQAAAMLAEGALAVQLDSIFWCGAGYSVFA
jgi:dihydroorotate dehydrogenase (NAD+) catalytic subunit